MPLWKCSTYLKVIPTIKDINSEKEMGLAGPDKEKCVPGKNAPGATGSSSHTHYCEQGHLISNAQKMDKLREDNFSVWAHLMMGLVFQLTKCEWLAL